MAPNEHNGPVTTTVLSAGTASATTVAWPTVRRSDLPRLVPLAAALALYFVGVADVDPSRASDIGLASTVPATLWAALGLVCVSFALLHRRRTYPTWLAGAHVVALAIMLFGLGPFADDVARVSVSWRHAGIAEHLLEHRDVDPTIDAYFNWPGFFLLLAFFSRALDVPALSLAPWVPLVVNLAFVVPLVIIVRAVTDDVRVVWTAAWLFLVANWIGQDYLAPQAAVYLAELTILAVLLQWFTPGRSAPPGNRVALKAVLIVLFAGVVVSHQLTPFAVLAAVTALVITGRCDARSLPLALAAVTATWIAFRTGAFLTGRLAELIDAMGDVGSAAEANVGNRLHGSPGHAAVVHIRLAAAAAMWALAAIGGLRWWTTDRRAALTMAAIAVAPVPLLVFQPYGGEMILRVQLYALPALATLAAVAVAARRPAFATVTVVAVTVPLMIAFVVIRYGNERFDWFSGDDIAAVEAFYAEAPPGATLLAPTGHLPWRSQGYAEYDYRTLVDGHASTASSAPTPPNVLAALDDVPAGCGYVIVTRSEAAYSELFGVWPRGALDAMRRQLALSPRFRIVAQPSASAALFVTTESNHDGDAAASGVRRDRCTGAGDDHG